jgi:hypothetical protein
VLLEVQEAWNGGLVAAVLATCFTLVSCLAYSLILKMEVTFSSKMSVDMQWTTWFYIPEDRTLGATFILSGFCLGNELFDIKHTFNDYMSHLTTLVC